jgi:hypothetical protein
MVRAAIVAAAFLMPVAVPLAGAQQAQQAQQGRGGGPPPTPQAGAPSDLTGNWVSVVTEDWLWRMVTPPKGDVASIPLCASPDGFASRGRTRTR